MSNYNMACTEVSAILDHLNKEEYDKIPSDIIETIEKNKDAEYEFKYDENVELKNQKLLNETKAMLFNIFRDYLSTPEQQKKIIEMQKEERKKIIELLRMSSENEIFGEQTSNDNTNSDINKNEEITAIAKRNKENFIIKIINKIREALYLMRHGHK